MVTNLLIITATVIILCVFLNNISYKIGVPYLLAFILLGMLFGTDGLLKIDFNDYTVAHDICTTAMIFIMFYGGFSTNWDRGRGVAIEAGLLSTLGVFLTAVLTGGFCRICLNMPFVESLLLGAIVSSTDAASVFAILRAWKLNLKDNTASLLELESGSNDPSAYILTLTFATMLSGEITGYDTIMFVFRQYALGAFVGLVIASLALLILLNIKIYNDGFNMAFVMGTAIASYCGATYISGNGYLSCYIVGIILGNSTLPDKRELVHFFDGLTDIMQMAIFFLLGLLCTPSRIFLNISVGLPTALFLLFVARPIVVYLILRPFGSSFSKIAVVSWAGLRGAASIVFAIVTLSIASTSVDIFHSVFFIVLVSILLQGTLLPVVSKKLNMIDNRENVMKTFNDYAYETDVDFIQLVIPHGHEWIGQQLKKIVMPPGTLIVMMERDGLRIIPNGETYFKEGDTIVLIADSNQDVSGIKITEMNIDAEHKFIGKHLYEIPNYYGLVIMIRRGGRTFIPNGSTRIEKGDFLVLHNSK